MTLKNLSCIRLLDRDFVFAGSHESSFGLESEVTAYELFHFGTVG